jgi:hypothetical protein
MKNKNKEIIQNKNSEKNKDLVLPEIINSEVNLLVFPFFALTRSDLGKKTKTEYKEIIERDGKKLQILWKVTSNSEYGYPGLFDREVHKVIEQIITQLLKEKGKIKNPIPLGSLYNICKKMGIDNYGGHQYRKIKEAFRRIKTTSIETKGTFYSKDKKQWLEDIFNLYERVVFKGEKINDKDIADDNYLYLGSWYLQNLNSFYVKPIDYKYLKSLESKIASRLYEILGVKFYGLRNKRGAFICYRYSKLCKLLPVTRQKYNSLARQQLDPGNNELKNTGFISKFEWSENGKNDWLIYYWPGERAKKEMKNGKVKKFEFKEDNYLIDSDNNSADITVKKQPELDYDNDLINQLIDLNVSKITAKNLVKKYNNEKIKDWIRAIDFTNAENKAAYIVKAVKEDWQLPEEYLREKENNAAEEEQQEIKSLQKKEQEKKQKILQEEKQKLDRLYHSLDPDKQKEIDQEAKNRLDDFWKSQLNKERSKGKLSKILKTTLDEKRSEIFKEWTSCGKIRK